MHANIDKEAPIASYKNGGSLVEIWCDGTKKRTIFDPSISPRFPEQMDLKITNWCDAGCAWCHEGSVKSGKHAMIEPILDLLKPLPAGVEIAIGGGDPLSHPQFETLVEGLGAQGLIANVTVNGRHVDRHKDKLEKLSNAGFIHGVGVSWSGIMPEWNYSHLVIHLIAGIDSIRTMKPFERKKLLILGYKNFGRGGKLFSAHSEQIQNNIDQWYRELPILARYHDLSFDTLAIEQLKPWRLFKDSQTYQQRFMGKEGEYSLYIDAVEQTYTTSSYSKERYQWSNIEQMFAIIREKSQTCT